jgi:hypothetical protein
MSDPLSNLAKTLSPSDPQTPVPSSASPFTVAKVATVNKDGTITANINAATTASTVYWANASVPRIGQKILVIGSPEGVQYATGVVGSATELPPLMAAYPVGAIYISTLATNPATLLGFGTWSAFAAGRTLIGAGTSDATYAAGTTGGASSRTISASYLPYSSPWSATATQSGHSHYANAGSLLNNSGVANIAAGSSYPMTNGSTDTQAPYISVSMGANYSGGNALPTVPPYVVTYVWTRTA